MQNPEKVLQASFIFLVIDIISHSVETGETASGNDVFHFVLGDSFRFDVFNRSTSLGSTWRRAHNAKD
jgi:hypothetical protein